MDLTFVTSAEEETIELGQAMGSLLRVGDVVALDGALGAGKTRLVRGIALGLGLDPAQVSSPTYVLVHEYVRARAGGALPTLVTPMMHIDAYRLSGPAELETLGWERVMDGLSVVVIEWAARIWPALVQHAALACVEMDIEGHDDGDLLGERRRIRVRAPRAWEMRGEWGQFAARAAETVTAAGGGRVGDQACAGCGRLVAAVHQDAPFCSARCRMADLGKWFSGVYRVSRALTEDDLRDIDEGEASGQG
jgi:tRNA threonylcarbamoyladenosine biosynthesis protein TsaE